MNKHQVKGDGVIREREKTLVLGLCFSPMNCISVSIYFTPLRPRKSEIRPLIIDPIIAPTVSMAPNIEYCIVIKEVKREAVRKF